MSSSLFLTFKKIQNPYDLLKKCKFLYVSVSYIYRPGTYKDSHQVNFDKFWLLSWKGACSCMFLALLLQTRNIQEHAHFDEKVWVLVCSCHTHVGCRNIQGLTPFHQKIGEKVWVLVCSWPIVTQFLKFLNSSRPQIVAALEL